MTDGLNQTIVLNIKLFLAQLIVAQPVRWHINLIDLLNVKKLGKVDIDVKCPAVERTFGRVSYVVDQFSTGTIFTFVFRPHQIDKK